MKQAKWLLLLAVGILMVLPGCKHLNPVVNPDVSIAASITEDIGTAPIMTGGGKTQTQIGDVYFYWQYSYFDSSLDPGPNGNGQYVDLMFGVKYVTYSPTYPITDAHLNISTTQPSGRGSPGLYNFNSYLQPNPPDAYTAIFLIPEADLMAVPWHCGDWLWFLCHVSAGGVTGMAGTQHRDGGSWWNDLYLQCTNPGDGHNGGDYDAETAWGYYILNDYYHFDNWDVTKWGGAVPYTLGTGPVVVQYLWAGAAHNDPSKGTIVGTVTVDDDVDLVAIPPTGNVYVTYTPMTGVMLSETHAGAAIDMPTLKTNSKGFAPGWLGVTHEFYPWVPNDQITLTYDPAWGSSFVVAAHAVVEIPIPEEITSE